jgi:hypothetical protein
MSVTLSISKGTLHVVVAFDIGFAVNLEACRRSVTDLTELAAIRHKGAAPAYFQFDPLPLRVTQRIPRLDLGAGFASTDEVEIVIYDFGGVSVIYDIPIQGSLEPLIQLSARLNASSMVRDDARSRIEHLMAVIEPAVIRPNIEKLTEEYYIVHVQAFEVPAAPEALIAAHAHDLARLLRAETDPLSDQEVQDALSSRASFGRSDVAIIDWNAAFLLDSEPQDVISVLEFANLQLLELRFLDARLDTALDRTYETLALDKQPSLRLPGGTPRELRRVAQLQVDGAVLFERINNALKLLGDQYLARVYRSASQRYRLSEWNSSIVRKLETLESIYEKLHDHAAEARMELLEWIIIILIAIGLVVPIFA